MSDVKITCVILDWDDTLLPSSHLKRKGYCHSQKHLLMNPHLDESLKLREVEDSIITFITTLLNKNLNVVIVTNSDKGWVQESAYRFVPKVIPILNKCRIVSAFYLHRHKTPNPMAWKYFAMRDVIPQYTKYVISYGDSNSERQAVKLLSDRFTVKSIKMAEYPSVTVLLKQHQVIIASLNKVINSPTHLDLMLTVTIE